MKRSYKFVLNHRNLAELVMHRTEKTAQTNNRPVVLLVSRFFCTVFLIPNVMLRSLCLSPALSLQIAISTKVYRH